MDVIYFPFSEIVQVQLTKGEAEALFDADGPRVRHEMNEKIWAVLHDEG